MRAFTNIGEKVGEIIPTFADLHAAPAVVLVCFAAWIIAALAHAAPDIIEGRSVVFVFASTAVLMSGAFVFQASTRFDTAMAKAGRGQRASVSTIALTQPDIAAGGILIASPAKSEQSSETLVGDIFGEAHGTGPIGSREAAGSVFAAPNSLRTIVA